ncbi:hypothetical protein GHT06_008795 [Daphnia sinensis]|uniref:ZSWIM1/3 RNaseH-like domain-containing protein n=1 Tax=Daphnia sinensis TaxID=1820382 RepID=A0AAD5Q0Z8_9CRUS|nr:hypothetical protein GHT06_008795 [Daphnia sinensis]
MECGLADQRKFYLKYGEVLQSDGTHNITQLSVPLYTLMVQDNFGVGQPVGFFFVQEETETLIATGLKYFCDRFLGELMTSSFTKKYLK